MSNFHCSHCGTAGKLNLLQAIQFKAKCPNCNARLYRKNTTDGVVAGLLFVVAAGCLEDINVRLRSSSATEILAVGFMAIGIISVSRCQVFSN